MRIPVIVLLSVALTNAQTRLPSFDVASIRPLNDGVIETRPHLSAGRFMWTTDLWYLTGYAWHLPLNRISGPLPGGRTISFRVEATMSPSTTIDQIPLMLRSLLQTRFHLTSHLVTKEVDMLVLTIDKRGFRGKEAKPDEPNAASYVVATLPSALVTQIEGRNGTMEQLVDALQHVQPLIVLDRTGISGNYDFKFLAARNDDPESDAPMLATALRETLGLELKKERGLADSLVVESVDKSPAEN